MNLLLRLFRPRRAPALGRLFPAYLGEVNGCAVLPNRSHKAHVAPGPRGPIDPATAALLRQAGVVARRKLGR